MLTASPDLIALARSQIALLTHSVGAGSSAMYLAEEVPGETAPNLIEVVSYPTATVDRSQTNPYLLLPAATSEGALVRQGRLVLPLIYEGAIMGILTTEREDRVWTEQEQILVQQVANTLAIACALDRRCQWLEANQRQVYVQQRDFMATLLHQLRNPLTALRTFSKLLMRRLLPEDNSNRNITNNILREILHIQDLLNEADNAFTPIRRLQPQTELALLPAALELSSIDPMPIIESLINTTTAIAAERSLNFNSQIPAEIPLVQSNSAALREVMGNLVDNALKYTQPGGTVNLIVQIKPDIVEIIVQDTGVGIPESDLSHLFERSFRGQQANSNVAGSGLGLAIARDLVQKMQGEIHVTSESSQGSTFKVDLRRSL